MKRITLIAIAFSLVCTLAAQVGINADGSTADSSSVLHLKSQEKGFLLPRMTATEISNIQGPADGLLVYNTDTHSFYYYNSSQDGWREVEIGPGTINTNCGIVTDICGNTYNTILIGTQCWMAENLMTTKFNDGSDIPLVTDNSAWIVLSTPGYCWYGNDSTTYGGTYGALYNWHAANTANLCPSGWHVPNNIEWCTLENYVDIGTITCGSLGWVGSDAGGNLKEAGTTHWTTPNTGATNSSGFLGLPGGYRNMGGVFQANTTQGAFWSTTEAGDNAWYHIIAFNAAGVYVYNNSTKTTGMSIRCVKD